MSHRVEKFRKGILLFLRKFLVSKSFMDEKGGYHVFPSKFFGLTVPKNFVKETLAFHSFRVSKKLTINCQNIWHDRDSNPKPTAWERCCPNPTAVIYNKTSWEFWTEKKEKRPYWMKNFSCISHILRKITTDWIIFLVYYIYCEK